MLKRILAVTATLAALFLITGQSAHAQVNDRTVERAMLSGTYVDNGGLSYDYHKTCNDKLTACFYAKTDAFWQVSQTGSGTTTEPIKLHFWGTDLTGNLGYWLVSAVASCNGYNGAQDPVKFVFVHPDTMQDPRIDGSDMGEYVGVYFLNGTGPSYNGTNLHYSCSWRVDWNGQSATDTFYTNGHQN